MFFASLKTSEKFALISAAIVFLLALVLIVDERLIYRHLVSSEKRGNALGKITYQDNDVRRKSETRFTWMPLSEGDQLFDKDQIFTGTKSNTVLNDNDGSQFLIGENSLVKVYEVDNKLALDIGFGDIQLVLKPGAEILISNSLFKAGADGADIKVSGAGKELNVKVAEGNLAVNDGKRTAKISSTDEPKKLSEGKLPDPEDIEISLQGTFYNKTLTPQALTAAPPRFEWTSTYKFNSYQILFSYDESFKEVVQKGTSQQNLYWKKEVLKLKKDGKIYWKVQAMLNDGNKPVESKSAYFVLSTNKAPIPTFPTPDLRIISEDINNNPLQIHFAFEPQTPLKFYEVEISRSPKFDKILQSLIVNKAPALSEPFSQGSYYWRVKGRTTTAGDGDLLVSATQKFFIQNIESKKLKTPDAPQSEPWYELASQTEGLSHGEVIRKSENQQILLSDNYPALSATIEEQPIPHEFQVSKAADFSRLEFQETSPSSTLTWRNPRLGTYYFRVRSVDGVSKSDFSKSSTFGVKLFPPVTTSPTAFEIAIDDLTESSQNNSKFWLTWHPTILTDSYEIIVADKADFKQNQKRFISKDNKVELIAENSGSYFWKIRSLNAKKEPISDFSETHSFRLQKEFSDPQKIRAFRQIFPEHSETLFVVGKGRNIVRFRWSSPFPKRAKFQLQLAADSQFKNILLNTASDTTYHDFKKHLKAGEYYWKVRAKMGDIITDWTPATRFQVVEQKSFNLANTEALSNLQKINSSQGFGASDRSIASETIITKTIPAPKVFDPDKLQVAHLVGENLDKRSWQELFAITPSSRKTILGWPHLTWEKVENADNYVLEISSNKEFSKLVLKKDLNLNEFNWINSPLGNYYYRVSASQSGLGRSPPSAVKRISVLNAPPMIINPVQRVEWKNSINRDRPNSPFEISWVPVADAATYQIEIAKNLAFTEKKSLTSQTHKLRMSFSTAGLHYVRVRALDRFATPVSSFTEPYPIDFIVVEQPTMAGEKVTPTLPLQTAQVVLPNNEFQHLGFKWINGTSGTQFTLQVSQDENFKDVVIEDRVDKVETVFRYKFSPTKYYWRVGTKASDGKTVWSETRSFTAKIIEKLNKTPIERSLSSK
jgi:hypothetical protein